MKLLLNFSLSVFHCSLAWSQAFSEPPVQLYGQVNHLSEGSSYKLHRGELVVTLVNQALPSERITLKGKLGKVGPDGRFSYTLDLPQQYLPSSDVETLSVGSDYRFSAITIDGESAQLLDSGQSLLNTSFAGRGQQHRLDLLVSLPQADSDSDGIPDWWEDLYDLNPLSAADATSNTDGDDWTALQEFLNGGDPTQDNRALEIPDALVLLPAEGKAGVYFTLPMSNVDPEAISFAVQSVGTGLSISQSLFTYQDILNGDVTVSASGNFFGSQITLLANGAETSVLSFRELNPGSHNVEQPVIWLDAGSASEGDSLEEWGGTGGELVAFQPTAALRPLAEGINLPEVSFDEGSFFYLNDSAFDLENYTLLSQFSLDKVQHHDGTLFNTSDLRVVVGGTEQAAYAQTLKVTRRGERILGPAVPEGDSMQMSLRGDPSQSVLALNGTLSFVSQAGGALSDSFGSIGARQDVAESEASDSFSGSIGELIVYPSKLDPKTLSRVEDYQLSRWQKVVLWDYRNETVPLIISGVPGERNSLNGGWGQDSLIGGGLDDIIRGGPGNDTFTGGEGSDRFQIFPGDGDDLITDFTESDTLDLSPLFEGQSGLPSGYLTLSSSIEYIPGHAPVGSTLVASSTGEKITLRGIALSNDDLPRLVANGAFYLGNLRFESTLSLVVSDAELTETEYARQLILSRTGNLESATDVYLSFVGSASHKVDYSVANAIQNGVVHKVSFPADAAEVTVDITPIQDSLPESEIIDIAVLPSSAFPSGGGQVKLSLEDAPEVTIESLVQNAQRLGSVPGVIRVSRSGEVDQPLDVRLAFNGSARNGEDFDQVTPLVSFAANEQSKLINITPAVHALDKGELKVATVSIVPDTTKFATLSPWSASVMILDKLNGQLKDYVTWRASLDPADNVDGALGADFDGFSLFQEYVHGLDPSVADSPTSTAVKAFTLDGRFVMEISSNSGMSDVRLYPESISAAGAEDVSDHFAHSLYPLSGDRIMHVFTSRQAVTEFGGSGVYRLNMIPKTVPNMVTDTAALLGSPGQPFLLGTTGWIPASNGGGIMATPREFGEKTILSTVVEGQSSITFDWEVISGSGASLAFEVDGTTVAQVSELQGSTTINHPLNGTGQHQLRWVVTSGLSVDEALDHHAFIKNLSIDD